ncbi:MAG: DUF6850 family outer membrane beta-barrel protein [Candidatus Cryptobacteroides sp.]
MKAKYSLFTISLLSALLCFASELQAQSPYERVLQQNLWNLGLGVNGIRQQDSSAAEAGLCVGIGQGGLRAPWEASSYWTAAASTRAVCHLANFSMTGAFAFEQLQGVGMCGPMSIEPGYFPVEVWEFTPGQKTLQTYLVDGGISVDVAPSLRLGARYRMNSRNYSKRKDLRHTNYRLDMECAAGLMWSGDEFSLEFDGILAKKSELISAEQIGTAAGTYDAFLDKGLMYGVYELWNGSGIHLSESGLSVLPLKENIIGAALEASYGNKLYASLQYRFKNGSAGEKEYIWFRFPGRELRILLAARLSSHTFSLSMDYGTQNNSETVLDKVSSGGVSTVTSYGSNLIFQKRSLALEPQYEYSSDLFSVKASVCYFGESALASQMYPYLNGRNLSTVDAFLSGRFHNSLFEFELWLGAEKGWAQEWEASLENMQTGPAPQRFEQAYGQLLQWQCAAKLKAGAKAMWFPGAKDWFIGICADVAYSLEAVPALEGRERYNALLSLGLNF